MVGLLAFFNMVLNKEGPVKESPCTYLLLNNFQQKYKHLVFNNKVLQMNLMQKKHKMNHNAPVNSRSQIREDGAVAHSSVAAGHLKTG